MKKIIYLTIMLFLAGCSNPKPLIINLNKPWKFKPGDNKEWLKPGFDDSDWDEILPDKCWEDQKKGSFDGYAWYRLSFVLPSDMKQRSYLKDSLKIIIGCVDDADETYLNGNLIGINNRRIRDNDTAAIRIARSDSSTWNVNRVYTISANDDMLKWDSDNVLAIRVNDFGLGGGLYSGNQSIRMKDIADYICIDLNTKSYEFLDSGKIKKQIEVKNTNPTIEFDGKINYSIREIKTNKKLLDNSKPVELKPGTDKSISVIASLNTSKRYRLYASFTERNSGLTSELTQEIPYILSPPVSMSPKINGPKVFGAKIASPILYRIPASGDKPMKYYGDNLPYGVKIDSISGILSGKIWLAGEYPIKLKVKNKKGTATKEFKLIIGEKIALTPPMGWNSWNCWGLKIDSSNIKKAADLFISSGLADHGWTYINIDDGWEAPQRLTTGEITGNNKMGSIKKLTDYIHSKGLKAGIYSSPGPFTCGKFLGSYQHEYLDAYTYAMWEIDYLKYDWCSYGQIAKDTSLAELQKPYKLMRTMLSYMKRDIVFSLCQYGMGNVWEWGEQTGGNLWRTTGDITDTWKSLTSIGFGQYDKSRYATSGHWNDPDMLVLGWVGWGNPHPTNLNVNEQYTHFSLWCLLSAPLLLGCDLSKLDEFTLSLLTNDEVLAIDQDALGNQASRIYSSGSIQVWGKNLDDGTKAIGFFNLGEKDTTANFNLNELNLKGKWKMRDLWRQTDIGLVDSTFVTEIPTHGVYLSKFTKIK